MLTLWYVIYLFTLNSASFGATIKIRLNYCRKCTLFASLHFYVYWTCFTRVCLFIKMNFSHNYYDYKIRRGRALLILFVWGRKIDSLNQVSVVCTSMWLKVNCHFFTAETKFVNERKWIKCAYMLCEICRSDVRN